MRLRPAKILLWTAASVIASFVVIVLLLMTSTVQTMIGHRILQAFNSTMAGNVTVGRIHTNPSGDIHVYDVQLSDEDGKVIAGFDSLVARLSIMELLRDTLHIRDLAADGIRLDLEFDSSGSSNLQRALASRSKTRADTLASKKSDHWVVQLDSARLYGGSTTILLPNMAPLSTQLWAVRSRASFARDSLKYELQFDMPEKLSLTTSGEMQLGEPFELISGNLNLHADSTFVSELPPPASQFGTVDLNATFMTSDDSLRVAAKILGDKLGRMEADLTSPFPFVGLVGNGSLILEQLTPSFLWKDTTATKINGKINFRKSASENPIDGWDAHLTLTRSSYGEYSLASSELRIQTKDSTISVRGNLDTGYGAVNLDASLFGLEPETAYLTADVRVKDFNLHHFSAGVPDSLSPITGRMELQCSGLKPHTMVARAVLSIDTIRLGHYELAALATTARLEHDSVHVDSLRIAAAGGEITGNFQALLGSSLNYALHGTWPDLSLLQPLLPDSSMKNGSLEGALSVALSGTANLAGDLLSHVTANGDVRLTQARFGDYSVARIHLRLLGADLDSMSARGALAVYNAKVGDQSLDSLLVRFDGNTKAANTTVRLWARGDTLQLSGDFDISREDHTTNIVVNDLSATAYGIGWRSERTSTLTIAHDKIELDWMKLRSKVGVLSATGTIQRGGEQDFVLEMSGLQTGELARILKTSIPSANINIRVQIVGPDTSLIGDLTLTADSIMLNSTTLADEFVLNATADQHHANARGFVIWKGDTLTTIEGELPARISLEEGAVVADSLPMNGRVRLLEQSLDRLSEYLPFGTKLAGLISGDVIFKGTPAHPEWSGSFSVQKGKYQDSRVGLNYSDINIAGNWVKDTLRISQFRASSKGSLKGSGWAVMAFPMLRELYLDLNFDNFEAVNGPQMRVRASGDITVDGPLTQLDAKGEIRLNEALYRITQATTKSIEEIDLQAELAQLRGDTTRPSFLLSELYAPMSHELALEIPGNCWLRGGGINIELSGNLWLYKDRGDKPIVNGEIRVRNGQVQFLGRNFIVDTDNSAVRYEGPIDNPTLDLQADFTPPGKDISVHIAVSGPLTQTKVDLSGTDQGQQMTLDQIVLALVTGGGRSGVTSASAAANIEETIASGATSQISGLIGRLSGLDVFEYKPGEGGLSNLSTGSLEVGTYITDRIFVRVKQPIEAKLLGEDVSVEYRLLDWLKMRAQQHGEQSSTFDMFVQVDWR